MLTPIQRRRLVLAGVVILAVVGVEALLDRSSERTASDEPVLLGQAGAGDVVPASEPDRATRLRVARALDTAVAAGPRHHGRLEVALVEEGWRAPIVRTSDGDRAQRLRAWSVSKVFTAVALLDRMGWDDDPGAQLSPEVAQAMERALVRSENCPQRRLTLELQRIADGTPESAGEAIGDVLSEAGAKRFTVASQSQPPEELCTEYMERAHGVVDPRATALLAGTSTWTVGDAARFALALGSGTYGKAISHRLLSIMRQPKLRSEEIHELDFTAPLEWGLGAVFGTGGLAYKAGWGGTQQGAFVAEQVGVIASTGRRPVAIAMAFHPDVQPSRDDPGVTAAPAALAEAAAAIKAYLD
jgi:hypothetical protein